jgi:hypothetical protein
VQFGEKRVRALGRRHTRERGWSTAHVKWEKKAFGVSWNQGTIEDQPRRKGFMAM